MSTALDQAIYSKLKADTVAGGVNHATTGATSGFHNPVAPQVINGQPVGFPRIHFMELVTTATYSLTTLIYDSCYYQLTAYAVDGNSEGITVAKTLAERIRTLLTDPVMSVTGKTLLKCRFERSIPQRAEWDDTSNRFIYSQGVIVEAWLA